MLCSSYNCMCVIILLYRLVSVCCGQCAIYVSNIAWCVCPSSDRPIHSIRQHTAAYVSIRQHMSPICESPYYYILL